MVDLPAELWTQVFDLSADEDVIFQHGLPTAMAESAWFRHFNGQWDLRSPQQAIELVQRRSYATKKAIVRTCKQWRSLGSEFLYRCLFFSDPARLLTVCSILDASTTTSSLGWWTRRIHLTRFHASSLRGTTTESLQDALVSIIRHCPNLEIFIVDWPMATSAFVAIADALATYARKSLRTLHINVPSSALPKVIWALDSLPHVFAAQIELEAPTPDDVQPDDTPLGAARDITLRLPGLRQLSVKGHVQELLEQATGWTLPSLRHLSIDCGNSRSDLPDTLAFLRAHGAALLFLDLDGLLSMPMPRILAACPALTTLAFNGDWRVIVPDDEAGPSDDAGPPPFSHDKLVNVGLHGLSYAFGVGYAAAHTSPLPLSLLVNTSANDRTLAALSTPTLFPSLQRLRVLSRTLLGDLERADGPGEQGGGMERWERWWEMCRRAGVRLEDCTGGELGVLPAKEEPPQSDEEDEDDEDESEYEEDWEEGEEGDGRWVSGAAGGTHLTELQKLLDECRAMEETRDENYMFNDPAARALFPEIVVTPAGE